MTASLTPLTRRRAFTKSHLGLLLLFGIAFSLATILEPRFSSLRAGLPQNNDPLASLLGEGRKLFANHFYIKADVYFHSGFYPTMFDNQESHKTPHMAEDAGVAASHNSGDEEHFLGDAANWIDAHGRRHFPSHHTHLGQDAPGDHLHAEREILPWLKFSATLDPNKIETYTVAAYWLRRTGLPIEAEKFLRDGLNANAKNPEITFELGRCRFDAGDADRARNLWELAWTRWQEQEAPKSADDQDRFLAARILMSLAVLESNQSRTNRSVHWLETLKPLQNNPVELDKRIAEVSSGQPLSMHLLAPRAGGVNPPASH